MARTIKERTPTMMPGVTLVMGKKKPETRVGIVKGRKRAFHGLRRLPLRRPKRTMSPDAMPMRLMATCRVVKVAKLIPRIMMDLPLVELRLLFGARGCQEKY